MRIQTSPEEVFKHYAEQQLTDQQSQVGKQPVKESWEAILANLAAVTKVYNLSQKYNFRSAFAVFNDYHYLVSVADARLREAPKAMKQLLLTMLALGMEFRAGSLTDEDISLFNLSNRLAYYLEKEKTQLKLTFEEKVKSLESTKKNFLEKYKKPTQLNIEIVPLNLLYDYFLSGCIDTDLLNEHLIRHHWVVGYDNMPAWRKLWLWYTLPRSVYLLARNEILSQLSNREITDPLILLQIAAFLSTSRITAKYH